MDEQVVAYFRRRDKIREALLNNTPKVLSDLGLDRIMLTPSLSNWLKANGLSLKHEEAEAYANCLNDALHWYEEFKSLPSIPSPAVVHQIVDSMIDRDRSSDPNRSKIKCKGGCSACCYIKVSCTEDEGRVLAQLVPNGAEEKLQRQAKKTSVAEWATLSDDDAACVFLNRKTGRCTVYDYRPAVCRLAYSLTGPSTCGRKPTGTNTTMIWFRAEAVVAAYVSLSRVGGMANMILDAPSQSN